jgi:para-aminobenzoate synthetase component II
MVLLIDNYDSFVYNLARYISELGYETVVKRNDEISLKQIEQSNPSHIIISPGPCTPNEAGISMELIKTFGASLPILGVCLGHQAIGQVYGGHIKKARTPVHGRSSAISHTGKAIFAGLANPLTVARYHSLVVDAYNLPTDLVVTAKTLDGEIMAIQHISYPVYGVQFHPESILTQQGHLLLENFLKQN